MYRKTFGWGIGQGARIFCNGSSIEIMVDDIQRENRKATLKIITSTDVHDVILDYNREFELDGHGLHIKLWNRYGQGRKVNAHFDYPNQDYRFSFIPRVSSPVE